MIMTSNTYFEGYRELTDHFKIDPRTAIEALDVASQFCSAQVCSECTEGGCTDCKGRQAHEYQLNSGESDNAEISEIMQEIVSDADYVAATKKFIRKEMEDLESKFTGNIKTIPDEVYKALDDLNIKLGDMEETFGKTENLIEIADRLHRLEDRFRKGFKGNNEKSKGVNIPEPIPERKTFQTEYEDSIHPSEKERKNPYGDHAQLWG